MSSFRLNFAALAAALSFAPLAAATCYSYGIDFQNGGSYFINELSTDNFTFVTQFEGCEDDVASVTLTPPVESQGPITCSDIALQPDDVSEVSTCEIAKDEMYSGEWMITLRSNNGDGDVFDSQKIFYLTVGDQTTTTVTDTVTWSITSTPTSTVNSTSTVVITDTITDTSTITSPAGTAPWTKTITPAAVTSYATKTSTNTRLVWTEDLTTITSTQTLSCTVPPKAADPDPSPFWTPSAQYASLYANITVSRMRARAADPPMDDKVRARLLPREPIRHYLEERAPDSATITVTADTVANTTTTFTASATTTTDTVLTTSTVDTTLPPATVYSGTTTSTVTAATPTKTYPVIDYTVVYTTETLHETWTFTEIVTPTASVSACKNAGGHFKPRPKW